MNTFKVLLNNNGQHFYETVIAHNKKEAKEKFPKYIEIYQVMGETKKHPDIETRLLKKEKNIREHELRNQEKKQLRAKKELLKIKARERREKKKEKNN